MADLSEMMEAIKAGIMTEIKGHQLYTHAASQTEDPSARAMFTQLAQDEEEHVRVLEAQLKSLTRSGKIDLSVVSPAEVDHGAAHIIDDGFLKSVKRGKFEMAVVGIGCDLENKAIAYYGEQAAKAEDPDLKKLFTWMKDWEVGHLEHLMALEKMLQDEYWSDLGFSPM